MNRKTALVTGASRGIGASTALAFAEAGWDVALTARDAQALEKVAVAVRDCRVEALVAPADVGDRAQIEGVFAQVIGQFGRLDALVNNAAVAPSVDFLEMTAEEWERTVAVNLAGPVWCAQLAARQMVRAGGGVIVNISSVLARQGTGIHPAYVICKGGLQALTRELAVRFGPDGIRAVTVTPGHIDTGITDTWTDDAAAWLKVWQDMTPIERAGRPEEVGKLIVFLCGDGAAYISGTEIVIDGGRLAAIYPKSLTRKTIG